MLAVCAHTSYRVRASQMGRRQKVDRVTVLRSARSLLIWCPIAFFSAMRHLKVYYKSPFINL
ncbi:MAG: hypothetical protein MUE44_14590 [Oscillatoriaceae cyanobacterium Prado104]|nr:hypothetical protein [Oscillatoriaceae cyanobacterium Prado104]